MKSVWLKHLIKKAIWKTRYRIEFFKSNIAWKLANYNSESFSTHCEGRYSVGYFEHMPLTDILMNESVDQRINESFRNYSDHLHKGRLFEIGEEVHLESKSGYVISKKGKALAYSFNYPETVPHISLGDYFKILVGIPSERLPRAVSLRGATEGNYWHFFDDHLSKLRLLDEELLLAGTPILVGKGLWRQKFFQQIIQRPPFSRYNWRLHDRVFLIEKLTVSIPASLQKANLAYAQENLLVKGEKHGNDLIFLTRSKLRGRTIENIETIIDIVKNKGFKVLDTDSLDLDAQIFNFQNARLVIGIHGAGLVNTIFRGNGNLFLMEIFHPEFIHPHYRWLASVYGFGYHAIVGDSISSDGNFRLNSAKFEDVLNSILERIDIK
jgi:hypothetical protein